MTPERLLQDGFAAHRAGRIDEAEIAYRGVLEQQPLHFDARHLLGVVLRAKKQLDEAKTEIRLALAIDPSNADACNNLANILLDLGEDAEAWLRRAVRIRPVFFQPLLALAQRSAQRPDGQSEADEFFARAAKANPHHPDAYRHWGEALEGAMRYAEAVAVHRNSFLYNPSSAASLERMGRALRGVPDLEGAAIVLKAALCLDPAARWGALHLAAVQFDLRRLDQAKRWFAVARVLNPEDESALLGRFNTALYSCDWTNRDLAHTEALRRMRRGPSLFQPFSMLAISGEPAEQLLAARAYSAHLYDTHPVPLWRPGDEYRHERLRIGYLSADLHTHATAYLMAELIEVHDRSRFEIIAFSYGPNDGSPMRERLIAAFDDFHDIQFKTDREAAELIRRSEIDILIDLKGYTQHVRPAIAAYRPAPAQVNYLGYPGTLGSPFHDYVIGDSIVIPPQDDQWFSETVIRLPGCYQVNDGKRAISSETASRREEGLPDEAFVFCCFNNNWKISPTVFARWMGLLRDLPGSVLWLIHDNDTAKANLRAEAGKQGVDPERLIFTRRVPLADHLARHRLADLFLDTLPYGAHTTASDALFAGLPVLTCRGTSFAGRVAASLLTTLGVPELIAEDLDEYVAMAKTLATGPEQLEAIRLKIMTTPGRQTLFDARAFAQGFEEALLSIARR